MLNNICKTVWSLQDHINLADYINTLAEDKYRSFQLKLLPNVDNFIGVRIPHLQKIAKQISKGDYLSYLKTASLNSFELTMIYGLVIGNINDSTDIVFPLIDRFIPTIDNWSICDSFCAKLKIFGKYKDESFDYICAHLESNSEFEIRFAVVSLLFYFIDDYHIDTLFKIFDDINHKGYYVKMAVAWAISICFTKYRNRTFKFLHSTTIDAFTYNKTLQKICESLCVSSEDKSTIKQMKRISSSSK